MMHGSEIVDPRGRLWRAFAPGWRLWLWLGFLARRVVVARLPGRMLPLVGWSPSARIDMTIGMPPRRVRLRVERVETPAQRVTAARRRWLRRAEKRARGTSRS